MTENKIKSISRILIAIFIIGIIALIANFLIFGKSAWGSLLSNFIYFTALSQGTFIIVVAIRAASGHWSSRFFRLGQSVGISFMPFAVILMLTVVFVGHKYIHFWAAHPDESSWFNPVLFVVRNLAVFTLFYLIALRTFRAGLTKGNKVKPSIYHKITMSGFLLIAAFFIEMTVFSWDMSMTLSHGYMDSIYPFRFMAVSLFGGLAFNLLLMSIARKHLGLKEAFPKILFKKAGTLLFAFSIIWFYTWWAQFFPVWYSHIPEETGPQFYAYAVFRIPYLAMMFFSWFVPWFSMLFHRMRHTVGGLTFITSSILIGHWIQRYIETVPAMEKYANINGMNILNPLNVLFGIGLMAGLIFVLLKLIGKYPAIVPSTETDPDFSNDLLIAKPRGWN